MKFSKQTGTAVIVLSLVVGGLGLAAAGKKTSPQAASTTVQCTAPAKNAPAKTILFFMNPNGHPCQMQKGIIDGMKDSLSGLASITFIKTTEDGDRDKFYQYGIRGLPSLIIVDKNGNELKRFAPGIQDESTILSALREKEPAK